MRTKESIVSIRRRSHHPPLIRATANRATLAADLQNVPAGSWAEITVKLDAPEPDLDRQVREAAAGRFEVLKVLADLPATGHPLATHRPRPHDLQPRDVFRELLKEKQLPAKNSAPRLMSCWH
jgi:DNA repair protein SbcD/Mre11